MGHHGADSGVPGLRLASFYFFYFTVLGALVPYWSPYLAALGFSPAAIGVLMGIFMGTRVVAPLLFGWLADRSGRRMALVRAGALVTTVTFAGVFVGNSFAWLALVMGTFSFAWSAVLPPLEAVTLNHLGARPERYGRIRLWGSLGFIVAVVSLGALIERFDLSLLPPVCLGLFAAIALASFTIPDHGGAPRDTAPLPLGALLRQPSLVALLGVGMLAQTSHGPYYTFFTIHLQAAGYSESQIGPLWGLGVVAEIAVFFVTSRLLARFTARRLLLASLLFTALRWALTGPFAAHVAVLVFAQLLHAFSFGVFHAVNMDVIHRTFQGRHQSFGQALYSATTYGVGSALGAFVSGFTWTRLEPDGTFLAAAVLPLVGFVLAAIWFHPAPRTVR